MSESRILDRHMKTSGQIERLFNSKTLEFEVERVATKSVSASGSDDFTVLTVTSGKRLRIFGGSIIVSKEAACAGACNIELTCTVTGSSVIYAPLSAAALVATGNVIVIPIILPTNGLLMPDTATTLTAAFSAALTAGSVGITVYYGEE